MICGHHIYRKIIQNDQAFFLPKTFQTHRDDDRLAYTTDFAAAIHDMPGGRGWNRHNSFTSETKIALSNTLNGLASAIRHLQSDRLEGEFGIYR